MKALMAEKDDTPLLIVKAQAGNKVAFQELTDDCWERLLFVIRSRLGVRLKGQLEAEDVLQETLLQAFQSVGTFEWRGGDSFMRWLSGIAGHVILKQAYRGERLPKLELDRELASQEVSPSKGMRREERFTRLQTALERLGPEQRRIVVLARFEGCSLKEIARRMNKTPAAVGQTLSRALRELRTDFGDTESLHLPDRQFDDRQGSSDARQ